MQYSTFYAKLIPNGATSGTKYSISVAGVTSITDGQKTFNGTDPLYFSVKPKSSGTAVVTFINDTTGDVIGTKNILVRSTTRAKPTYTLTSNVSSVNEGGTVKFTLNTTDIGIGSVFAYSVSGITANDLVSGSLTGDVVIDSAGFGYITFVIKEDNLTEGTESMVLTIPSANSVSKTVTINDTSLST